MEAQTMTAQLATFGGFLALQLTFWGIEKCTHKRAAHGHFIVWLAHPTVLHSFHDWGIFLVSEGHLLFGR
jgi:hypothetical protein